MKNAEASVAASTLTPNSGGAHSAPAGDLLALHQARPGRDVTLQPRDGLLAPQRHRLHAGHVLPLLQVDPVARRKNRLERDKHRLPMARVAEHDLQTRQR